MNILVLRFNAMGDVALVLPVVKKITELNPDVVITIATKPSIAFLFENIENVNVLPIAFDKEYKGISGLVRLHKHLAFKKFDFVIDLHDVLRTQFLRFLFKGKSKILKFTKGRSEKNNWIHQKQGPQLKHTTERYLNAFRVAGLATNTQFAYPAFVPSSQIKEKANKFFEETKSELNIGLAPFAAHETKTLPINKIETLLHQLTIQPKLKIYFFSGPEHQDLVSKLQLKFGQQIINTHPLDIETQIALMLNLDKMIAVDSANMHFAAMQGISTISIWGSTTPELGFYPLPSTNHEFLQTKNLFCRPCSVYGNKKCTNSKQPLACLQNIDFSSITEKL
jgi:ADP-heptose:LPS heptosyltransferase